MSEILQQAIHFPNNRTAHAILATSANKTEELIRALSLPSYKAVLVIIGSAGNLDPTLFLRLTQLFGRGIARAAVEAEAIFIDGGTHAGVMALMGEGVAARGYQSALIGVAPVGKVSYPGSAVTEGVALEPNHTHFVLAEGAEWGSETSMLFTIIKELTVIKTPALVILAGGGKVSKDEVLRTVRHNLPLLVIEGSGGLADELAAAHKEKGALIEDPVMAEIIADGDLHFHSITNSVKGIQRLIIRKLGADKVLFQAWETFAKYNLNANLQQVQFKRLQNSIIIIGVVGVALVIIQQVFAPRLEDGNLKPVLFTKAVIGWWAVYHLLIIIPILLTILVTASNRFKQGKKWLLLRAGAEAIKREIYRYRTRTLEYVNNGEQQLSKMIEGITRRTMLTEVNLSSLEPYDKANGFPPDMNSSKEGDDGFSCLAPDRYVEFRLADQLAYFQRKAPRLERQLRVMYWMIFIIGGAGSYLAATNNQAWVALTTSIVAAFGTFLGYRQTENILLKYNQAATDLTNVGAWWEALSAEQQSQQININSLVEYTEQVLQAEADGWIQQMQNALADLRKGQEPADTVEKNREGSRNTGMPTVQAEKSTKEVAKQETPPVEGIEATKGNGETTVGNYGKASEGSETILKPVGQFE